MQNYHQIATVYPPFWPAVRHNVIWLLVFIVLRDAARACCSPSCIDRGIRGSRIYQSVLFLPVMLSLALIGIIWEFIYSPNFGLINTVIGRTGNTNLIDWLGNPRLNLWAVLVEATLAPGRLRDGALPGRAQGGRPVAARGGARSTARTRGRRSGGSIFPVLRPINIVILVVTVIESLRAFDLVYITNHGTQRARAAVGAGHPEHRRRGAAASASARRSASSCS